VPTRPTVIAIPYQRAGAERLEAASNTCSADLEGPESTVRMVTTIAGIMVGLTFLFGFGNVVALGLRLGVPIWVALLIPAS